MSQLNDDLTANQKTDIDETSANQDTEVLNKVLKARKERLEEKKERQEEAYSRLADKHSKLSNQAYQNSTQLSNQIPFGQPILIGHHSEKRHRRHIEKIGNEMDKSISHQKTAEYYQEKLHNLEHNNSISSDNPDAITLLEEKLKLLQENQTLMKSANKIVRSKKLNYEEKIAQLIELGLIKKIAESLFTPDFCGRLGYPDYRLSNNNQEIRRVRERIEILKKQQQEIIDNQGENKVKEYPNLGLKVVENFELNRIQLCFENKPPADVRKMLKNNGFRWSSTEIAWQRPLNNAGRYAVGDIIRKLESN